jgi:hypothetical protein
MTPPPEPTRKPPFQKCLQQEVKVLNLENQTGHGELTSSMINEYTCNGWFLHSVTPMIFNKKKPSVVLLVVLTRMVNI